MLGWEARRDPGRDGPHAPQKLLHVGDDALGRELRGHDLTVEERDGQQVGERVVGLLLACAPRLVALFAAADDVVGDIEDVELDPLDIGRRNARARAQLEQRLDAPTASGSRR